jgi:hypothetical protein
MIKLPFSIFLLANDKTLYKLDYIYKNYNMRFLYLLIITFFITHNLHAQNYQPIGFDTSCYWIHHWHNYNGAGPVDCSGTRIAQITKDTLINNQQYWKVEDCPITPLQGSGGFCIPMYYGTKIAYIREDTITQKIYMYNVLGDNVLLNYNLAINDTFQFGNMIVDSITTEILHNGDSMLVHHGVFGIANHYKMIQKVGANYNFIFSGYGEWATPFFSLISFTKQQKVVYFDSQFGIDTLKKPCYTPNSLAKIDKKEINFKHINQVISFDNYKLSKGKLSIVNMVGECVWGVSFSTSNILIKTPNLASGIYVVKINMDNYIFTEKIRVE